MLVQRNERYFAKHDVRGVPTNQISLSTAIHYYCINHTQYITSRADYSTYLILSLVQNSEMRNTGNFIHMRGESFFPNIPVFLAGLNIERNEKDV